MGRMICRQYGQEANGKLYYLFESEHYTLDGAPSELDNGHTGLVAGDRYAPIAGTFREQHDCGSPGQIFRRFFAPSFR